jgi:hypothetical protein
MIRLQKLQDVQGLVSASYVIERAVPRLKTALSRSTQNNALS